MQTFIDDTGVMIVENGIRDHLSSKVLPRTPEEMVRQSFIHTLHVDYGYPLNVMQREVPIQHGSKVLIDSEGKEIRADIVVYNSKNAAINHDQGNIRFIVECKKPTVKEGYAQLVSYIYNTSAVGGVWTNGDAINIFRRQEGVNGLLEIPTLPRYTENWNGEDSTPMKKDLPRPHNIRFLLSSCHNKLYGRGMENEDFDLAMDMVRILLAKIQDEISPGKYPKFWITSKQYETESGRLEVANTIQGLFREYADQFPDVFESYEKIQVGIDSIAEVVGLLKNWSLAAKNDDADDWDLMGETYEQFTHINLKRQQGQFFTNRLVVNMMVEVLDPQVGERSLDPAGGSGGFATAIFRYLRRKIINTTDPGTPARERQISSIKESIFLVEIASRLVKIAKCAMLLTGDGQSGMTQGNSLRPYTKLDSWIQARCMAGKGNAPDIIATNPPFSGQKIESQISDKLVLSQFAFGHNGMMLASGKAQFSTADEDILVRQAPELLFLERCLDWLKPGGRMGIVLPKGFLDNKSYETYRSWILERYQLNAVVTLHKDTFQPDTGVRTCIIFMSKPIDGEKPPEDYPIFMAQSQRIGQDSRGNPVYILDGNGAITGELNHDLNEIALQYKSFLRGEIHNSEFIFSIKKSDIKDFFNINPQHYSPRLNATLNRVMEFDNIDGWSTTTIGQLESDMEIYIGPRWASNNIRVENPVNFTGLRPYLTANAALELRRTTVKWFDVTKADKKQLQTIQDLQVKEGDILISRSGTIGKVTYATKDMAENYMSAMI